VPHEQWRDLEYACRMEDLLSGVSGMYEMHNFVSRLGHRVCVRATEMRFDPCCACIGQESLWPDWTHTA
jgi:hypothetical protein